MAVSYCPDLNEFKRLCRKGNLVPVYREIMADLETPVSAFLKIEGGTGSFLLESVEGGEKWARYSFLGSEPSLVFSSKGDRVWVRSEGRVDERDGVKDPLQALEELMAGYRPALPEGLPRFFGGAVGYMAYDMVRFFERLPELSEDDLDLPDCFFIITDSLLIFDNVAQKIKVVCNAHLSDGDVEGAYRRATERIEGIIRKLKAPRPPFHQGEMGGASITLGSNFSKEGFEEAVLRAKGYVEAGDAIQVVLSQRLEAPLRAHPFNMYRALRTINPSPYMFYLRLNDLILVGSSPEVLVRREGERVEVRPIAGTRPRGRTELEDRVLEEELLSDVKERAEHIMLVDLGRNDVGRVSRRGTVEVNELMVVERYSHVMHIVSNVRGELASGKTAYDVMRACFPAGTVSGAPKVRAMEIIDELEPTRRGPYAGAVGYFGFTGNMDTCITIRTIIVSGGKVYLQVGAGVVYDSTPEREFEETMNKGRALIRAMEMAQGGLD